MESTRGSWGHTENTVAEGADGFEDFFFRIIDELERIGAELLYRVGNAVNARLETLHWILDISSRWSEVLYFSPPIKRKHGW